MKFIKTANGAYINPDLIVEFYVEKVSLDSAEVNVGLINGSYFVLKKISAENEFPKHFDPENEARIWLDNFVGELQRGGLNHENQ